MGAIGFLIPLARSVLVLWSLVIGDLAAQIADQRDPQVQFLSRMRRLTGG
jgi:hypothetical protein